MYTKNEKGNRKMKHYDEASKGTKMEELIMEGLLCARHDKKDNIGGDFTIDDAVDFFTSASPISKFVFVYGGVKHLKREFVLSTMKDLERKLEEVTGFLFDCSMRGRLTRLVMVKKTWNGGNSTDEFVEIRISEAKSSLRETNIDAEMIQVVVSGMRILARRAFSMSSIEYAETNYPKYIGNIFRSKGQVLFDFQDGSVLGADTSYWVCELLREYKDTNYISDCDETTIYLKPIKDWLVEHNITNALIRDLDGIIGHKNEECSIFSDDLGMP